MRFKTKTTWQSGLANRRSTNIPCFLGKLVSSADFWQNLLRPVTYQMMCHLSFDLSSSNLISDGWPRDKRCDGGKFDQQSARFSNIGKKHGIVEQNVLCTCTRQNILHYRDSLKTAQYDFKLGMWHSYFTST